MEIFLQKMKIFFSKNETIFIAEFVSWFLIFLIFFQKIRHQSENKTDSNLWLVSSCSGWKTWKDYPDSKWQRECVPSGSHFAATGPSCRPLLFPPVQSNAHIAHCKWKEWCKECEYFRLQWNNLAMSRDKLTLDEHRSFSLPTNLPPPWFRGRSPSADHL